MIAGAACGEQAFRCVHHMILVLWNTPHGRKKRRKVNGVAKYHTANCILILQQITCRTWRRAPLGCQMACAKWCCSFVWRKSIVFIEAMAFRWPSSKCCVPNHYPVLIVQNKSYRAPTIGDSITFVTDPPPLAQWSVNKYSCYLTLYPKLNAFDGPSFCANTAVLLWTSHNAWRQWHHLDNVDVWWVSCAWRRRHHLHDVNDTTRMTSTYPHDVNDTTRMT